MTSTLVCVFLLSLLALPALAVTPPVTLNVWPGRAPGETTSDAGHISPDRSGNVIRLTDVTCPQIHVYRLDDTHPHPTVLVCPGGGYGILADDLEGSEVARWLNLQGYTAAVLDYRVPDKREAAFQDIQRAVSVLRARAKEFGVDPKHLGVMGFSAGGHLSARLAAGYGTRAYAAVDGADRQSCRPDFALLIYPAYLIDKVTGQPAPEVQPHPGMPPVFLVQTEDDPYLDAPTYAAALEKAGVSAYCVVYKVGGHGYGLRAPVDQPVHLWPEEAAAWLQQHVGEGGKRR